MHPDAAAFERAILANPTDRTGLLIYADWCDEHDDPDFAAALRSEEFVGIPAVARVMRSSLMGAWLAVQAVMRFSAAARALGESMATTVLPVLRDFARAAPPLPPQITRRGTRGRRPPAAGA